MFSYIKELKRYGHTLGLSVGLKILSNRITVEAEGNNEYSSMCILAELLGKYASETNDSPCIKKISDIITYHATLNSAGLNILRSASTLDVMSLHNSFANLIKRLFYHKNNLICQGISVRCIIVKNSSIGHAFYIAYSDKYLAISDRGGKIRVCLFNLKPGAHEQLNRADFNFLSSKPAADAYNYLGNFINGEAFLLDSKTQKYGTCSFVNLKSLLKALLVIVSSDPESIQEYKKFSTWLRKHEITSLIKKYLISKGNNDEYFMHVYKNLLLAYIQTNNPPVFSSSSPMGIDGYYRRLIGYENASDFSKQRRKENTALIYTNLHDDENFSGVFDDMKSDLEKIKLDLSLEQMSVTDSIKPKPKNNIASIFFGGCKALLATALLIYSVAVFTITYLCYAVYYPFNSMFNKINSAVTSKVTKQVESINTECNPKIATVENNSNPVIFSTTNIMGDQGNEVANKQPTVEPPVPLNRNIEGPDISYNCVANAARIN